MISTLYFQAIDCRWKEWSSWGNCSQQNDKRRRERGKSGPYYDGKDCQGESIEYLPCDWVATVDCKWHQWGEWEGLASMHHNH